MTQKPTIAPTTIYVVPTGQLSIGDYAGVSVTADRVWFHHVSSTLYHLAKDTTDQFTDRREQLEAAYPNGYKVVLVALDSDLPPEIAHYFEPAEANGV